MKREYKYTIAIDLDGIIADFEGEFCDRFGTENRMLADLVARYPQHKDLILEMVDNPESYRELVPMFGGILFINHARRLGFYVVILTGRPKKLADVTRTWLEDYDIQYNEIIYASNKSEAIREYNTMYPSRPVKMLVDDMVHNLWNLPDGVVGVAWEQPWNLGYYPRVLYNADDFKIHIKDDTVSNWRPFWEVDKYGN